MQNLFKYSLIIALLLSLSCSKDEVAVIGIPLTFDHTYTVSKKDTSDLIFTKTQPIDATDDADVSNNLERIEGYDVNEVKYLVTNLLKDSKPEITSGFISFDMDSAASELRAEISNVYLDSIAVEEQTLDFSQEQLTAIGEILKNGNKVYLTATTELSDTTSFNLKVILEVSLRVGL